MTTPQKRTIRAAVSLSLIAGLEHVGASEVTRLLIEPFRAAKKGALANAELCDIAVYRPAAKNSAQTIALNASGRLFIEFVFEVDHERDLRKQPIELPADVLAALYDLWLTEKLSVLVLLDDSSKPLQENMFRTMDASIVADSKGPAAASASGEQRTKEQDLAYIQQLFNSIYIGDNPKNFDNIWIALSIWRQMRNYFVQFFVKPAEEQQKQQQVQAQSAVASPSEDSVDDAEETNPLEEEEEPVGARAQEIIESIEQPLMFRITGRRGGAHRFGSMDLAIAFVDCWTEYLPNWDADLRNFHVEVVVYVWVQTLTMYLTVTDVPISKLRIGKSGSSFFRYTSLTLKPSLAAALWYMADVESEDVRKLTGGAPPVVLDLCCGSGMSLVVASHRAKSPVFLLGGDLSVKSLPRAAANIKHCGKSQPLVGLPDLVRWNFESLPLRSDSVDIVISNLPFGKQCSSQTKIKFLYPRLFKEIIRILRVGGKAILLTSEKAIISRCANDRVIKKNLKQEWRHGPLNQGGLQTFVYVFRKHETEAEKQPEQQQQATEVQVEGARDE